MTALSLPRSDVQPSPVRRATSDRERAPRPLPAWAVRAIERACRLGVQDPRDESLFSSRDRRDLDRFSPSGDT